MAEGNDEKQVTMAVGRRLTVFAVRKGPKGTTWVRAGCAFVNRDSSLNLYLDVLPIDGQLHVREAAPSGAEATALPLFPEGGR